MPFFLNVSSTFLTTAAASSCPSLSSGWKKATLSQPNLRRRDATDLETNVEGGRVRAKVGYRD